MTEQITAPVTPDVGVRRGSYMAALSLAEQIVSVSLALPADFSVKASEWAPDEPELRFYFHRDAGGLRQFCREQRLTESVEHREDGSVYIEAAGEPVRGVRVVAWTLFPAEASAVAA